MKRVHEEITKSLEAKLNRFKGQADRKYMISEDDPFSEIFVNKKESRDASREG